MWEYKVLRIKATDLQKPSDEVENTINELGQEDWELVNIFMPSFSGAFSMSNSFAMLFFKRPVEEEESETE